MEMVDGAEEAMTLRFEKNQKIVFDGDSLTNRRSTGNPDTWPFLRLMNWDKPWPDLMAEMLFCWRPDLNLSFFNAASAGSTCRGLAERFEKSVLARKPDWTIASLAGNDQRVGVPLDEFRETLTTYARRLTKEVGGQVLFFGLSEQGPDCPAEKLKTVEGRRAYYAVLADIAGSVKRVHYVDVGPAVAAKARLLKEQHELHTIYGDGGHFNAVGNLIIAGEILRVFGIVTPG
jgi:lysophospholipase L1-like esterase